MDDFLKKKHSSVYPLTSSVADDLKGNVLRISSKVSVNSNSKGTVVLDDSTGSNFVYFQIDQ